jgi:hypothetical protein
VIDSIVRFLWNNDLQSINKRLLISLAIGLVLLVVSSGLLSSSEAEAKSVGLKVSVHVSGDVGNVCVR